MINERCRHLLVGCASYIALAVCSGRLALAVRPVQLDQSLHATAEGTPAQVGLPLFTIAAFAAIGGHVIGILIPVWFRRTSLASPEHTYRQFAATAGTHAAVLVIMLASPSRPPADCWS